MERGTRNRKALTDQPIRCGMGGSAAWQELEALPSYFSYRRWSSLGFPVASPDRAGKDISVDMQDKLHPHMAVLPRNSDVLNQGRKKKVVSRAKYVDNKTVHSIASCRPGDRDRPAPTALHHQLQERPTEIHRLFQHNIGAICAVKLDLLLDNS